MNRDEILNMPAGREMDAMIDKHVFGKFFLSPEDQMKAVGASWHENVTSVSREGNVIEICSSPHYSTYLEAAWYLLEKLKLSLIPIDEGYFAGFYELERFNFLWTEMGKIDGTFDHCATATTAPLAICRAALLATLESD